MDRRPPWRVLALALWPSGGGGVVVCWRVGAMVGARRGAVAAAGRQHVPPSTAGCRRAGRGGFDSPARALPPHGERFPIVVRWRWAVLMDPFELTGIIPTSHPILAFVVKLDFRIRITKGSLKSILSNRDL